MSPLQLAPLPAAQDAEALGLLDQAFACDPTLAWYLFDQRPGYEARRRAYLAGYQAFHRTNRLPTLGAWQNQQLLGLSYFSPAGHQPSAASLEHFGEVIRSQCGADCLERLDLLLEDRLAALDALANDKGRKDAVVLACFGDPGLAALKEVSSVPVVGMADASILQACAMGSRFSIVTGGERWKSMLEEFVANHGLTSRLASVRTVAPTGADIARNPKSAMALLAKGCTCWLAGL